jgi:DNA polymerase III sliding clamp (beta) subunit (PCNA family)
MEFTIDVCSLQRAIKVLGIVVRINADDGAGRILIESIDQSVIFTANNGVTAISFTATNTDILTPGTIAVEYGRIKAFVFSYKPWNGVSGANNFQFASDGRNTKITIDNIYSNGKIAKGELRLANSNPALITKLPPFGEVNFILNSTIFKTATNKILYAINPQVDNNQPALQGMSIQFDEDSIFFAGSNGVVLSEYQVKNMGDYTLHNISLQYDFIMGLRRLITENIQLLWDVKGNKVSVKFGEIVYTGRKIIGHEFPEYKPVFDRYTNYINLSKEFFIDALHPFIDVLDVDDNCRITVEIKDNVLKVFNSQATVEAELDIAGGLDFSIDLNGKLLIQTIEAIKDDFILFKFSDAKGFAIFDSSTFNDQKSLISSIKKR